MSEGTLSQAEINALFNQSQSKKELSVEDFLTEMEQSALGEIGNISLGSSTTALSTLLSQRVEITTPTVAVIEYDRITEDIPDPHVAIHVDYTIGFRGTNLLVIKERDAKIIANLMMGGDGTQLDDELSEMHLSAVQEAMNQMMGSAATSMSTLFKKKVDISPPSIDMLDKQHEKLQNLHEDIMLKISFQLKIGDLIDSNMMQLIPYSFGKEMIQEILVPREVPVAPEPARQPEPVAAAAYAPPAPAYAQPVGAYSQPSAAAYAPPHMSMGGGGGFPPQPPAQPQGYANTNMQKVEFMNFSPPPVAPQPGGNLDMLFDIPLAITVELGRTEMQIRKVLELGPGAIIELDKLAGEPVDILANNKLIARGEVVVIEENFGVRITDIISPIERLTKMTS